MKKRLVKEDQGWGIRDLLHLALAGDDAAGEPQEEANGVGSSSMDGAPEKWYRGAVDALKADQLWEALLGFAAVVHVDPAHVKAWNNLGVILYEWGIADQAQKAFERVLQLDPDHVRARENLEAIHGEIQ